MHTRYVPCRARPICGSALGLTTNPDLFRRVRCISLALTIRKRRELRRRSGNCSHDRHRRAGHGTPAAFPISTRSRMLDSRALVLVGSDEAHYTASSISYLLSGKPLLAIFTSRAVNEILKECAATWFVGFSEEPRRQNVELILQYLQARSQPMTANAREDFRR